MLVIRTFPLLVAGFLFVSAGPTINKRESDDENPPEGPHDMTDYCQKIAEFSGSHYCDTYDICCSPTRQFSALYCTQREYVCTYDNATNEVTDKKCVISGCFYPTTPPKTAVTQASEADPTAPSGEVPPEAQARPGVEGTPGNETETAGGDGDAAPGHSLVLLTSISTILLAVFYQNPVIL
ncbi:unnamed protein product, partial [Mesorhabditis belari]|uniref:Uncharacterized protein n=1 Tax=Mesorhabditis belari TaxID=2138241 RepID=A0AAF3FQ84_9BILA